MYVNHFQCFVFRIRTYTNYIGDVRVVTYKCVLYKSTEKQFFQLTTCNQSIFYLQLKDDKVFVLSILYVPTQKINYVNP